VDNIKSPEAVRDTSDFKFELYRAYENEQLKDMIMTASQKLPKEAFTSGKLSNGALVPTLKYIQTAASYRISFTLKNTLLGLVEIGDSTRRSSGIIIVFPTNMPPNVDSTTPTI